MGFFLFGMDRNAVAVPDFVWVRHRVLSYSVVNTTGTPGTRPMKNIKPKKRIAVAARRIAFCQANNVRLPSNPGDPRKTAVRTVIPLKAKRNVNRRTAGLRGTAGALVLRLLVKPRVPSPT